MYLKRNSRLYERIYKQMCRFEGFLCTLCAKFLHLSTHAACENSFLLSFPSYPNPYEVSYIEHQFIMATCSVILFVAMPNK